MKKLLNVLLVFMMCFGLLGCGGASNAKEPKEIKNILEKNEYDIILEDDMVIIQNTDEKIQISTSFINDKMRIVSLSDFSDISVYQLYPDLDTKGDSVFYDHFNDYGITVDDMITLIEWYYNNFNE